MSGEPGVEALARAILASEHWRHITNRELAGRILAALTSADRLAIAGITAAKLETAIERGPDSPPPADEPPYCRFPRWDKTDRQWLCCHGGGACGGCSTFPQNCTAPEPAA